MKRSSGSDDGLVRFSRAKGIAETPKAVYVECEEFPEGKLWIPISVIDDDSEVYSEGDKGELVVKAWWCREHGLE